MNSLQKEFGNIDIYLFDQLLKGRFEESQRVLDAGCGGGRNLVYFLQHNFDVYGIDEDPVAIEEAKKLSKELNPKNSLDNFSVEKVEALPFEEAFFDVVLCNAVLHFARNEVHFDRMLRSIWKVLKPNGHLLIRLASDIGIEDLVKPLGDSRYLLPDDSIRFLVNQEMLLDYTEKLNGQLFEYIKTTNVQNLRCMTTWCLQKK
jgi:tellurite methyltransferase